MKWWDQMPWSSFSECWALSQLFHSPLIKRLFSSSSLSVNRVVSSAYLRWLIFLPEILILACASSSPAFLTMYSAYKLNKQCDNIQPWRTPFPIWNQSVCQIKITVLSYRPTRKRKNSWIKGVVTTDWFQIGKGVRQGCILSPCLFNLYAEYIMRNAGLDEAQARIKISGRNINNLRYADDTNHP